MRSNSHNDLQDTIKARYQAVGWIAIKEHYIEGKKIDVLVQNIKTKYTIANEVQLTTKHYKENILRDLGVGCHEVQIISINRKVSDRIKTKALEELDERVLARVKFLIIEDLIPP